MAKRLAIPSKYSQMKIVGPRDAFVTSRVQRVAATADSPTTTIDELGNSGHAGTAKEPPSITVTFQTMDVGINNIAVMTGVDPDNFPAAGVTLNNSFKDVDVIVHIRDETVSDYVKMIHLRRLAIQSFAYNYSVDGDSTEEYTLIGSTKRYFKRDVVVEKFTTGTTSFSLGETPIQLKNGDYALSVILDEVYLEEVAAGPGTGQYSISGTTLTTGDNRTSQLIVVYQANPAGNNWNDTSDDETPAAIKGKDVELLISAVGIERVQSMTIDAAFNPQPVREMGNRDIVGYLSQVPEITGTLTVLDTDTQLAEFFTTGTWQDTDTEFVVGQCAASGVPLEIQLLDPAECDEPYTVLKTIYLAEVSITSEAWTSNVNDNATQTFDWRSDDGVITVYSGARP